MGRRWLVIFVLALVTGLLAGRLATAARDQVLRRDLFTAVQQELVRAHLPPQDLPKRVIDYQETGPQRYRVHMEMGQGEAWFEVWREAGTWRVRGINPPSPPPSAAPR